MQLYDHDLERTVNGSLLLLSDDIQLPLIRKLNIDCFHDGAQRAIYQVISKMTSDGLEITAQSFLAKVNKLDRLAVCGGKEFIDDTVAHGILSNNIHEYINMLREYKDQRCINDIAYTIINLQSEHASKEFILQTIDAKIKDLDLSAEQIYTLHQCLNEVGERIESPVGKSGEMFNWMPENFIDMFPDGITKGMLMMLQAASSKGKSTLAGQMAYEMANKGKNVLYVTCEDGGRTFGMRTLCHLTQRNQKELLGMGKQIHSLFDELPEYTKKDDNFIIECETSDWLEIERKILMTDVTLPLDFVVVDYLQILRLGNKPAENRTLDLEAIMRGAKTLAMKLQTIILMVSQEKEDGSAKWCAAGYDMADCVIRIKPADPNDIRSLKPKIKVEIIIAKNKIGTTQGSGWVIWNRPIFKFEPYREVKRHEEFIQGNSDYE